MFARIALRLPAIAVMLGACMEYAAAQGLTLEKTVAIEHGGIWCIPVFDGQHIVVSAETPGTGIRAAKYDLAMNQAGAAVLVAGTNDTYNHDTIADHKHIFQNDHHYLAFSTSGNGSGGYLYLLKLDRDLQRVAICTVVSNDPPTNDMLMVGDGTNVHVGKFLPGTGHRIYSFDAGLNALGNTVIGGGVNQHANGAAAIFAGDCFHVVAPNTLAPGQNDVYGHMIFDRNWNCISNKQVILTDPGVLSIVSGLSRDPVSGNFILSYTRATGGAGGAIYAANCDPFWNVISNRAVAEGTLCRPHSAIVSNRFYLGYDGSSFAVSVYAIASDPTGPLVKANGSRDPLTISGADELNISVQLNPAEYAGAEVDWWVVALAGAAWYYLDGTSGWTPFDGGLAHCQPVYQGALFDLPATAVLNISGLAPGQYRFWFAVDYPLDGNLDPAGTVWCDEITITVE